MVGLLSSYFNIPNKDLLSGLKAKDSEKFVDQSGV